MKIIHTIVMSILLISQFAMADCKLRVSEDGHYLVDKDGKAILLMGDTVWRLAFKESRENIASYLKIRKQQRYNLIAINLHRGGGDLRNYYGDLPFEEVGDSWAPDKIITTKGKNPKKDKEYDYWDHVEYLLDQCDALDMFVSITLCHCSWIVGSSRNEDTSKIVYDEHIGYEYAYFLGKRFRRNENILWMLGGDRAPAYPNNDYRHVFRAMAEGIADGIQGKKKLDGKANYSGIMMSYHPMKIYPNSATWFHNDPWLSYNSVQACPYEMVALTEHNYQLKPTKPTWYMEGRYEYYTTDWKAWPMRFQAYLTLFAGSFGHIYGHRYIWGNNPGWMKNLYEPAGLDMQHIVTLFNDHLSAYPLNTWIPNQTILADTNVGSVGEDCWKHLTLHSPDADKLQAMTTKDHTAALVYSTNGRNIKIDPNALAAGTYEAFWFDPRFGTWNDKRLDHQEKTPFATIALPDTVQSVLEFDPNGEPEADNDWVLLLEIKR